MNVMKITDLLNKDAIKLNGIANSKQDTINKLVDLMAKNGNLTDKEKYKEVVLKREEEGSTGVGEGIAIPHGKGDCVTEPGLVAMVVPNGVEYDALDGKPVNLLFMIAAPNTSDNVHLDVLSRLSTMLMDTEFKNKLISAKSKEEFLNIINETENEKFKEETRYTGEVKIVSSKETKIYTNKELNRSVINPAQIKLILSTYRDVVYTELFNDPQREPNMDYLPKTLIFALNEAHATNIVQIAKEVFGRTDDRFVQKITYSAGDSNELIRQFRNDKDFRIAVTCTLVATGTDVKPLEVVMFMRDVESLPLYIQMKGRGVRTIGDEQLRNVTPNAFSKDCFYLVDAVGVTEHAQTVAPIDDGPTTKTITLKELLERISHGYIPDEYLKRLAATLARIYNKADDSQRKDFVRLSHDDMKELSVRIYDALERGILPLFVSTDEPNNERKGLVAPLANHADARKYLLILAAGFVNTLMPGEDTLISKGFSIEEAKNTTEAFEDFCKKYYDEIEALRIIYNNEGEPITYSMLKDLENRLKMANNHFTSKQLWNSYAIVNPKAVRRSTTKEESDALTNIIQLVRFAFHQIERLDSIVTTSKQFFNLWLGQNQREITDKQREVISRIVDYIASNGACTIRDIREDDATHAAQMIRAFGNMQKADEALHSLYTFVVLRKAA